MAGLEAVVFEKLINELIIELERTIQVANPINILRKDFESFKNRIEEINSVLNEENEESATKKESARKWLHRVQDIAWEAEDILQQFDSMYATDAHSFTLICRRWFFCIQMDRKIRRAKAQVSSVLKDGNQLNISSAMLRREAAAAENEAAAESEAAESEAAAELKAAVSEAAESSSRNQNAVPDNEEAESANRTQEQKFKRRSLPPSDSKPVGIDPKIESMVSLLENSVSPIIAVLGCGGIGKTYLLDHVYISIKGRYQVSVWLSVSQFLSVSKLQRDLASQVVGISPQIEEGSVSEKQAAELIHEFFLGKKYLIVLDDVWKAGREDDLLTRLGLPTEDNRESKILISTRSGEFCRNLRAHIYEMEYLTDEESLRLVCAYAFPGSEGNRLPEHLKKVGLDIVNQCGRLPLALKITAASLASTTLLMRWQSKLRKLEKAATGSDHVMDILKVNYDSLPAQLKTYFAYLSFFPEDEIIECEYLIYLWMAEGFIPREENPWDCLDQLANLCLVEVWEDECLNKYCKIHGLVLDLAIRISRDNRCAFSVEDAFCKLHSVNKGGDHSCHLFLAKKDIDEFDISESRPISPTIVRTLSLSGNSEIGGNIPSMLLNDMRVLRVLDLSYTNISTLPACVGKMKFLRVLNLRKTKIVKVPDCVRHLKSLCYLNVSNCNQLERSQTPKWISELRCLQHLEGPFERMPREICKLQSLRTLRISECGLSLSIKRDGMLRLQDVFCMSKIEELCFRLEHQQQLRMMKYFPPLLENMRRLEVNNQTGTSDEEFPKRMIAMRNLEHLTLFNFVVPGWICCLANLRYLSLRSCQQTNFPELQTMSNLVSLEMLGNTMCTQLPEAFGKSGGFPHLRFFKIIKFLRLEEFPKIEDGAMARLEKLELSYCGRLNKMEGLEHLRSLKELNVVESGTEEFRRAGGI